MKIDKLSDKIDKGGCILEATDFKDPSNIEKNKIIEIFEDKGIILFKKFNFTKDEIIKFTDKFTQQYANDANRRESRFKNN